VFGKSALAKTTAGERSTGARFAAVATAAAVTLAEAEGLQAHARSVAMRLGQ